VLGHLGINVPDLTASKSYYDAVMPLLGFDEFFTAEDEFAYLPAGGKPGTYLFFYRSAEHSQYSRHQTGLQHLAFRVRTRSLVNEVHGLLTSSSA
jgi:catechol 2,3-dioxygenase-like lactoylglutathione lyase family enzyme